MARLRIAVAKGRLERAVTKVLEERGVRFPDEEGNNRRLMMTSECGQYELLSVKAQDVPIYVEKGAADLGVAGNDTILEEGRDVYEVLDLGLGCCKLVVAGFPTSSLTAEPVLKVATKYPTVAEAYFTGKGIRTDISKLNGSIELAPLAGLSDVIVDIVESGTTLRDNGLVILHVITEVSARVIVNKASFATRTNDIRHFLQLFEEGTVEQNADV